MLSSACKVCFRFLHTHVSGCSVWMFWKKLLILGSIFMKNFWSDWLIWKWFRVKFLLYSRFTSSFCSVWKNDENILLILSAIALFTPERLNVVHQNVIKKVQVILIHKIIDFILLYQDGYFYLLQRYLQTKFGGCQAQEVYLTLIGKLMELHQLNDAHMKVCVNIQSKEMKRNYSQTILKTAESLLVEGVQ